MSEKYGINIYCTHITSISVQNYKQLQLEFYETYLKLDESKLQVK